MGRIYSNASRLLLIWPGDEVGEGNSGLILVSESDQDLPSVMRPRTLSPEELVSFRSLLQRPWFDRLWIVQELVLGAKHDRTTGVCGRDRASWTTLVKFVLQVDRFNSEYRHQFPLLHKAVDLEQRRESHQTKPRPLIWWMSKTRNRMRSDARDSIYALLGVADPSGSTVVQTKADYGIAAKEVFVHFAKTALKSTAALNVLRYCQTQRLNHLPSWVTDWSCQ